MFNRRIDYGELVALAFWSTGVQAAGKDAFFVVRQGWFQYWAISVVLPTQAIFADELTPADVPPVAGFGVPCRILESTFSTTAQTYTGRINDMCLFVNRSLAHTDHSATLLVPSNDTSVADAIVAGSRGIPLFNWELRLGQLIRSLCTHRSEKSSNGRAMSRISHLFATGQ